MSNMQEGIWRTVNLDDCHRVGHRIEVGRRELRITASSDSSFRLLDLSTESRLYFKVPGNLQEKPA